MPESTSTYNPSTYDKWGSEAGGAVGGAATGVAMVMPFTPVAGPYAPLLIGGAAVVGGIAGWLSNSDNEQQELLYELEQKRNKQIADAEKRMEEGYVSQAARELARKGARDRASIHSQIMGDQNLTHEEKRRRLSSESSKYMQGISSAQAEISRRDQEAARKEYDLLLNNRYDEAMKESEKASEVRWAVAEGAVKNLAYQQHLKSQGGQTAADKAAKPQGTKAGAPDVSKMRGAPVNMSQFGLSPGAKSDSAGAFADAMSNQTISGVDTPMYTSDLAPPTTTNAEPLDFGIESWLQETPEAKRKKKRSLETATIDLGY